MAAPLRIISYSIVFLLCLAGPVVEAQTGFFQKLEAEISYSTIDGWETSRGPYILEDNDGSALGIGLRYPLRNGFFIKMNYQRARIFSVDLQEHYGLSNAFVSGGRSFKVSQMSDLGVKIGLARLSEPLYSTFIIQLPGMSEPSVTHTYGGNTGFNYLGFGLEYKYSTGEELSIGLSADIYSAISSNSGATIFSLFINMKLSR